MDGGFAFIRQDGNETPAVSYHLEEVTIPGLLSYASWRGSFEESGFELRDGDAILITESGAEAEIHITSAYAGSWRHFLGKGPPPRAFWTAVPYLRRDE